MSNQKRKKSTLRLCASCGNIARHEQKLSHTVSLDYWTVGDGFGNARSKHKTIASVCATCGALSLIGGFEVDTDGFKNLGRLYPQGNDLFGVDDTERERKSIPDTIQLLYERAWPNLKRAPDIFVGQIRRCLEAIALDKGGRGGTLHERLRDLELRGIIPQHVADAATQLRVAGNETVHAAGSAIYDNWEASAVDQVFRSIVLYCYVLPERVRLLDEALTTRRAHASER